MISIILARMTPQDNIQTYFDMLVGMALECGWLKGEWGAKSNNYWSRKSSYQHALCCLKSSQSRAGVGWVEAHPGGSWMQIIGISPLIPAGGGRDPTPRNQRRWGNKWWSNSLTVPEVNMFSFAKPMEHKPCHPHRSMKEATVASGTWHEWDRMKGEVWYQSIAKPKSSCILIHLFLFPLSSMGCSSSFSKRWNNSWANLLVLLRAGSHEDQRDFYGTKASHFEAEKREKSVISISPASGTGNITIWNVLKNKETTGVLTSKEPIQAKENISSWWQTLWKLWRKTKK